MCIRLHGVSRVRRVLDPFIGLGSTAVAAQRLGVACVGFDIDRYYLDVAKSQLSAWVDDDVGSQLPLAAIDEFPQS
jgi:site-specific DNA-methyltransferase (adenine-specific)